MFQHPAPLTQLPPAPTPEGGGGGQGDWGLRGPSPPRYNAAYLVCIYHVRACS